MIARLPKVIAALCAEGATDRRLARARRFSVSRTRVFGALAKPGESPHTALSTWGILEGEMGRRRHAVPSWSSASGDQDPTDGCSHLNRRE
jgi:hypothetical protein